MYLFNGDLVDRGSSSVEVLVAVLAMKLAHYKWVHVNRGNHESLRMNAVFGFMGEVRSKYSDRIFFLFGEVFRAMPLATVVNNSIFVAHGGLSCQSEDRRSGVSTRACPEDVPIQGAHPAPGGAWSVGKRVGERIFVERKCGAALTHRALPPDDGRPRWWQRGVMVRCLLPNGGSMPS